MGRKAVIILVAAIACAAGFTLADSDDELYVAYLLPNCEGPGVPVSRQGLGEGGFVSFTRGGDGSCENDPPLLDLGTTTVVGRPLPPPPPIHRPPPVFTLPPVSTFIPVFAPAPIHSRSCRLGLERKSKSLLSILADARGRSKKITAGPGLRMSGRQFAGLY